MQYIIRLFPVNFWHCIAFFCKGVIVFISKEMPVFIWLAKINSISLGWRFYAASYWLLIRRSQLHTLVEAFCNRSKTSAITAPRKAQTFSIHRRSIHSWQLEAMSIKLYVKYSLWCTLLMRFLHNAQIYIASVSNSNELIAR